MMDGLHDFLFVRRLFLDTRPTKNIKKSDIKNVNRELYSRVNFIKDVRIA